MAGVLFKCWCAAYINPLRQGRDRLGQGRLSLPCFLLSIIYHHLFICLFLFTSLVSIHLRPASHPQWQLLSCSLHLCSVLFSVTPTFNLQHVHIYIRESLCFLSVSQELSIKRNCLCVSVHLSFSLCVFEPRDLVLLVDSL